MNNKSKKMGVGEKICYFLMNIGNIPLMVLLGSFFLIFYTDVVGLDPGALATLFLVSKPSCHTFGTTINETMQAIGY